MLSARSAFQAAAICGAAGLGCGWVHSGKCGVRMYTLRAWCLTQAGQDAEANERTDSKAAQMTQHWRAHLEIERDVTCLKDLLWDSHGECLPVEALRTSGMGAIPATLNRLKTSHDRLLLKHKHEEWVKETRKDSLLNPSTIRRASLACKTPPPMVLTVAGRVALRDCLLRVGLQVDRPSLLIRNCAQACYYSAQRASVAPCPVLASHLVCVRTAAAVGAVEGTRPK